PRRSPEPPTRRRYSWRRLSTGTPDLRSSARRKSRPGGKARPLTFLGRVRGASPFMTQNASSGCDSKTRDCCEGEINAASSRILGKRWKHCLDTFFGGSEWRRLTRQASG